MPTLSSIDLSEIQPDEVKTDHRGITLWFPGGVWQGYLDFADLNAVHLRAFGDQLIWHLAGRNGADWLIPFGIPGESGLRQELARLPGFNTHRFYTWLDDRSDEEPPFILWPSE